VFVWLLPTDNSTIEQPGGSRCGAAVQWREKYLPLVMTAGHVERSTRDTSDGGAPMPNEQPPSLTLVANPSPDQVDDEHPSRKSVEPLLLRRPELAPVLSRAMSAVIDAMEFGDQTPPDLIRELENTAATAMAEAYEPIADAAFRLARFTETTRTTEAAEVRRRAEEAAVLVSQTMTTLRQRHDRLVQRVAKEATAAARAAAASSVPGHKLAARKKATEKANAVRDAAAERADQWAAAAVLTAAAAEQAAARLATQAEYAAAVVERDALQAAAAIQSTALSIMYEIAIDAACRHFLVPISRSDDQRAP